MPFAKLQKVLMSGDHGIRIAKQLYASPLFVKFVLNTYEW